MGTHRHEQREGLATVGSNSYFRERDNSSSSALHLSLQICPSVPSWSDPEYLTLSLDKETPKYGCVQN